VDMQLDRSINRETERSEEDVHTLFFSRSSPVTIARDVWHECPNSIVTNDT